jgi:hypothetical protein
MQGRDKLEGSGVGLWVRRNEVLLAVPLELRPNAISHCQWMLPLGVWRVIANVVKQKRSVWLHAHTRQHVEICTSRQDAIKRTD